MHSFVHIGILYSSVKLLHVLWLFVFCIWFPTLDFLNTMQKVINGAGWLDDCHSSSPILCNTVTLVFTLFIYFAILFSFTLISTDNWFLVVRWLSVLFLFNNWVIWKDNKLESWPDSIICVTAQCQPWPLVAVVINICALSLVHLKHSDIGWQWFCWKDRSSLSFERVSSIAYFSNLSSSKR